MWTAAPVRATAKTTTLRDRADRRVTKRPVPTLKSGILTQRFRFLAPLDLMPGVGDCYLHVNHIFKIACSCWNFQVSFKSLHISDTTIKYLVFADLCLLLVLYFHSRYCFSVHLVCFPPSTWNCGLLTTFQDSIWDNAWRHGPLERVHSHFQMALTIDLIFQGAFIFYQDYTNKLENLSFYLALREKHKTQPRGRKPAKPTKITEERSRGLHWLSDPQSGERDEF